MLRWYELETTLDLGLCYETLGNLKAARCVLQEGCFDPPVAKAMAILLAIRTCRDMCLTKVQFEGDAKGVIDSVNLGETDNSSMGHIIEDNKLELKGFQQWQLNFIRRNGNRVAHLLARSAMEKNNDFIREMDLLNIFLIIFMMLCY
jgi:hypothetical protein